MIMKWSWPISKEVPVGASAMDLIFLGHTQWQKNPNFYGPLRDQSLGLENFQNHTKVIKMYK